MARSDVIVGLLHSLLDVLRVEVLASDDHQILDAATHEQPGSRGMLLEDSEVGSGSQDLQEPDILHKGCWI